MSASTIEHPGEVRWETRLLAVVAATLTVFGIASVYSAASFHSAGLREVLKQLSGAAIGGVAMMVAARLDYQRWRDGAWLLLGFTVALLVLLLIPGLGSIAPEVNGARRWIRFPGGTFQPSELARFAIVVWASMIAAKKGEQIRDFKKGVAPVLVITASVSLLVLVEPNLSMATVIALLGGVVLFTAGARIGQFMLLGVAGLFAAVAAIVAEPYRFQRVRCFFGLASDCQAGTSWQLTEATKGFGAGRLFGVGFGEGQLKLDYLPIASSDFLFATVGEEWGFLGVLFVILLFGIFCWLGFRIARTAPDPFGRYLATGLTAAVGLSALMHMAVNMGLMPTTGLALPFMSSGRASLLVTLLTVGVLISVGRMRGRPVSR
ncbi:MAG: cell division protein FtsW [Gemmatimonadetes bacterium]|nr:cell division protein FtsW [Gemmatimonadota bacterium]MCC7131464.1 cell division protein FtsW [Gemmatimonadales bacterium]